MAARIVQDFTGSPSISTTHAPQFDVSQPQCVPVRPSVSRMKWTSSWRGSISRETCSPLIAIETFTIPPPVHALPGARGGAAQGALREDAGEVPLVVDRPSTVRGRGAVRRGDLARLREQLLRRSLAAQQLLGSREMDRREPDRAQRDARVGDLPVLDPDGRGSRRDRPVAGAALDLLVRAAATRPQRKPDLDEQLAVADRGLVRPDVEVLHLDDPLAADAANHGLRLDRRADRREVLGRVRLAERAADRAAVAHDRVGDHVLGVPKERESAARARPSAGAGRAGSAPRCVPRRPPRGCTRARRGR